MSCPQIDYEQYELLRCLRLLKYLHDIGIYDDAVGCIQEVGCEDYYELALRGLEHVAPDFEVEELGEDVCCGGHVVYHFGDPIIPEYYRLCRLYEYKHELTPEENPYVKKADSNYARCCDSNWSDFGAFYNDDVHVKELCIETCPERPVDERDLIEVVHDMLEFYRTEVEALRKELLSGTIVYLPALPAYKNTKPKKQTKKQRKTPLKKAS